MWHKTQDQINYACIMLEGLFNTLGHDIIGANTIIPLFMAELGANMGTIGGLNTLRSIISAAAPLLFGGIVAAAPRKRNLSLWINGLGRGIFLAVPLLLTLNLPSAWTIGLFIAIMVISYVCQPITGISWNYLLGNCIPASKRGTLLGTLFGISGAISLVSSVIIKALRANERLTPMAQYAAIFGLGGAIMVLSVLCFLPLKEKTHYAAAREERNPRAYIQALLACFANRDYNWAIAANALSNVALAISAFFFLFAQNTLGLTRDAVSNLLVIQTLGMIVGGFCTGRFSARFGVKRMLVMVQITSGLAPVLGLLSLRGGPVFAYAAMAVCLQGFSRSGMLGFQAYILEVVDPARSVYYIVAKSMALLPFSFASVAIGAYLEAHSMGMLFVAQAALCVLSACSAMKLKSTVYARDV